MKQQQEIVTLLFALGQDVKVYDRVTNEILFYGQVEGEVKTRPGWYYVRQFDGLPEGTRGSILHLVQWQALEKDYSHDEG